MKTKTMNSNGFYRPIRIFTGKAMLKLSFVEIYNNMMKHYIMILTCL